MTQTSKPSSEQVRNWMQQRRESQSPPPSPERIREMLGWQLVAAEREQKCK